MTFTKDEVQTDRGEVAVMVSRLSLAAVMVPLGEDFVIFFYVERKVFIFEKNV